MREASLNNSHPNQPRHGPQSAQNSDTEEAGGHKVLRCVSCGLMLIRGEAVVWTEGIFLFELRCAKLRVVLGGEGFVRWNVNYAGWGDRDSENRNSKFEITSSADGGVPPQSADPEKIVGG